MVVAVIDLGTNTFNLLIAELLLSKKFKVLHNNKFPVKLGKGGITNNVLLPDAMQRGVVALEYCLETIQQYKAEKTVAFATSAIREAVNAGEFLQMTHKLGLNVTVVSGDEEAELIFKGVRLALEIGNVPALIMDIGGGSTEFIIADSTKIYWKQSFLLGVTRLLEKFGPSDPMTDTDLEKLNACLRVELKPLFDAVRLFPVAELIGSSGSFDSFADILMQRFHHPEESKTGTEYLFNLKETELVFRDLLQSDRAQRLHIRGLIEMRVDLIVMAVVLTRFVINELGLSKMRLSTYALKEGVLSQLVKEN